MDGYMAAATFNSRETWRVGSYCKVYSRSKNCWFNGIIDAIKGRKEKEWLHVRYGHLNVFSHSKRIQRNCSNIKEIPNDHPLLIKKGSKCKIYSNANKQWSSGAVIEIFEDAEGEWLKVRYASNNGLRIVEIQRFSDEIKLIPTMSKPTDKSKNKPTKSNLIVPKGTKSRKSTNINAIETKLPKEKESEQKEPESPTLLKSDSSYYLYKSTDANEAENYKPIKIDLNTAENIQNGQKRKGSSWNTGATMEQFDYSDWMKKRLETLLLDVTFKDSSIKISKVIKIEGSATVLLIRGKYRPGYDINIECKWSGYCKQSDKKKCNGTLKMFDIAPDDDPEDWQYEVEIKNKSETNKAGMAIVKNDRKSITDAINIFVKELYAKKS